MGIVVCGNFAFFEIVAERGNGLCWATGGMEVGYLREEHAVWWVVLFSSEATLASFVTRWTMLVRYRWTSFSAKASHVVRCTAVPVATTVDVVRMERDLQLVTRVMCWSGRL